MHRIHTHTLRSPTVSRSLGRDTASTHAHGHTHLYLRLTLQGGKNEGLADGTAKYLCTESTQNTKQIAVMNASNPGNFNFQVSWSSTYIISDSQNFLLPPSPYLYFSSSHHSFHAHLPPSPKWAKSSPRNCHHCVAYGTERERERGRERGRGGTGTGRYCFRLAHCQTPLFPARVFRRGRQGRIQGRMELDASQAGFNFTLSRVL